MQTRRLAEVRYINLNMVFSILPASFTELRNLPEISWGMYEFGLVFVQYNI